MAATELTKRVVVGYDGSSEAESALSWAMATATSYGVPLDVVVVATAMDPVIGDHRVRADRKADEQRDAAQRSLELAGQHDARVEIRNGHPPVLLVDHTGPGDLLVVGSAGHGRVAGVLAGSVSQQVARHAHCPVAVIRSASRPSSRRIGVGVDGSPQSHAALRWACERAALTGEKVVALHGFRASLADDFGGADRIAAAERSVRLWVEESCLSSGRVPVEEQSIAVPAKELLVDFSDHASLIVVGARGRDAVTEMVLGSTSQHVLSKAHCPVVVAR